MDYNFILSAESTTDLPYPYVESRNIPIIFYSYTVDDVVYEDDMGRNPNALAEFYAHLDAGKLPNTSQINTFQYEEYFRELLAKGDVLHLAFAKGMSNSVNNAYEAAEIVRKEFPDRKLIVVDTLASCSGYGLIVDDAADMRDAGASMEEIAQWVKDNALKMYHRIFASSLKQLRRGGRVSGPTAAIGTVLGIIPIMRLDEVGKIFSYSKVRGKKAAIDSMVKSALENARGGKDYDGKLFICQADCMDDAKATADALQAALPKAKISIYDIGSVIASHTGRGTVAIFFWGDKDRPAREE